MSDTKALVARLRDGCVGDKNSGWWQISEHLTDALLNEAANLIEQQAKELSEAQARVVMLHSLVHQFSKMVGMDNLADYDDEFHSDVKEALASIDTAAKEKK